MHRSCRGRVDAPSAGELTAAPREVRDLGGVADRHTYRFAPPFASGPPYRADTQLAAPVEVSTQLPPTSVEA